MSTVTTPPLVFETAEDLFARLGDVPPRRVRLSPPPGTATEADLLRVARQTDRLFELIDGTLVEKAMGWLESALAMLIGRLIGAFVDANDLGIVVGADAPMRLFSSQVRMPDVAFASWDRLPGRTIPTQPIPDLAPDLAVEVLSRGNTPGEMERKRRDYFAAGVRLVWEVDPRTRTVHVYTAADAVTTLTERDTLDGGDVLPGFTLPVKQLFARTPRPPKRRRSS